MTYRHLNVVAEGSVGAMTLNRPDKLNALSVDLMHEIVAASAELSVSPVRTVVVSGTGRAFSTGFDLTSLATLETSGSGVEAARLGQAMADAVADMRPVTVAALHGHVVGGGVVLAAACDLRLAAADTVFSIPEVDLGIPLAWGGIPRLVREFGPALTRELVMTCRPFSAEEAASRGFLNGVVPTGEHLAAAAALAEAVAARPALPVATTKQHVAEVMRGDFGRDDAAGLIAALADPESMAARTAYLERR